ncbi:MAG: L,D-transpeptidase [Pseudomonadota bacterium]|nr:L,D-transpeptidase [Pseudomonadota bacterium]
MRFVLGPVAVAAAFVGASTAQATVRIHVDLASQTMHVASSQGDYDWAVSTGRPGHRTPTGHYRPQRMYANWRSHKYDNAPMPHAIFFRGGYAIHGTYATGQLGQVASHGCIRLAPENAATLFSLVAQEGAAISITGAPPGREPAFAGREQHRHGHKLAAKWRKHYRDAAFAYAPHKRHHARSLRAWADNPLENQ